MRTTFTTHSAQTQSSDRSTDLRNPWRNPWRLGLQLSAIVRGVNKTSIVHCLGALSTLLIVLLQPSFLEFLGVVALDVAVALLLWPIYGRIFLWVYPECEPILRATDEKHFLALSPGERVAILEGFSELPKKAAKFTFFLSIVRFVAPFLFILFFWNYRGSMLARASIACAIALIVFTYIFGAIQMEFHGYLSRYTAKLHEETDLSESFLKIKYGRPDKTLVGHEVELLCLIIGFTLVLQAMLIVFARGEPHWVIALQSATIGVIGMSLFFRLWQLGRSFISAGMAQLFEQMEQIDYHRESRQLPVHTLPFLAQAQNTFNFLVRRLWISEQELSFLARHEAEKSRYQALGEMSARLAHDLSGPLHVAQFCVHELNDQLDPARRKKYLDHLSANVERAVELVTSLRARLKNPEENPTGVTYFDAHVHVVRLLGTQFAPKDFQEVTIDLDPAVKDITFKIQRVDLIQILDNLYRNSVQNLLSHRIPSPRLKISLLGQDDSSASILLSDNGTGLSKEKYEELTLDFSSEAKLGQDPSRQSLGLRLTRRLVELHGGSLNLFDPADQSGTTYCLKLKTVPQAPENTIASKGVSS